MVNPRELLGDDNPSILDKAMLPFPSFFSCLSNPVAGNLWPFVACTVEKPVRVDHFAVTFPQAVSHLASHSGNHA